jgi:UDP:flavonoid glycosyltransferase YjiC (YdhE family)
MRIVILAIGSRGDVQPYVALGQGLKQAGYDVVVATSEEFAALVQSHDWGFIGLGGNPRELSEGEAGLAWLESGRNPVAFARRLIPLVQPFWERFLADCWQACQGAEGLLWGDHVARLGVGPKPIQQSQLSAECLAVAIRQASRDETMRARASAPGQQIRREHGIANAVQVLQTVLKGKSIKT